MILYAARVIRQEEGRVLKVYRDTLGNLTVGVGHLIVPVDNIVVGDEITEGRCRELFRRDMALAEAGARRLSWTLGSQPPEVLHVLTCMVFQLGHAGTRGFRKMMAALRRRDYAAAGAEMLNSKWAKKDTPARAERLAGVVAGLAHDGGS